MGPILKTLVFSTTPEKTREWVDDICAGWDFAAIVPAVSMPCRWAPAACLPASHRGKRRPLQCAGQPCKQRQGEALAAACRDHVRQEEATALTCSS